MQSDTVLNGITPAEVGSAQGARRATEAEPAATPVASAPDPEVRVQADRRRFSAKYKLRIVEQADRCTDPGEVGALLRREGLYSSHLSNWRRLRRDGALGKLAPRKRGRKTKGISGEQREVARLRKENQHLRHELDKAQTIISFQKKLSEILEIPMPLENSA
jgi:transposase-like protein